MDIFSAILGRRSIRKYKPDNIPKEAILQICEAGIYAPSAGNLQDVRYVVVLERDKIKKIADMCPEQEWVGTANAIIIVCSKTEKVGKWYGERGEMLYSIQGAAASIENMLLTAHALGIGSCWIGAFDEQQIKEEFGIKDARPQAVITFGYPDEIPEDRSMEILEHVVYFNSYGNDKEDPIGLAKDYSIKNQQRLNEMEESARKQIPILKNMFKKVKDQINSQINKKQK